MKNHIKYSKGICWIGDCRIPFVDEGDVQQGKTHFAGGNGMGVYAWNKDIKESGKEYSTTQGRFTPNLLVCDDMLNDGTITKQSNRFYTEGTGGQGFYGVKSDGIKQSGDKGTNSRYYDLDKWFEKMIECL
jgi:hypothetical protein